MRIPEKLKNRNVVAFLFFGVVLIVFGWKWARDNGYLSSPPSSPRADISEVRKDAEVPSDPFGIERETSPASPVRARNNSKEEFSIKPATPTVRQPDPTVPSAGQTAIPVQSVASPAPVSAATQSELMRIQADIMLLEAQVKKARLQAELEKLETPVAPAITELTPEMLASLTPPSGGKSSAPVMSEPKARLVGVQGTEKMMTATVSMPSGLEVTVAVGDTLQGSKVRTIGRDGLRLANGKRIGWE